jgi:hypothetical protein
MKLTNTDETIIAEDSGALLRKCIAELEKDKNALQRAMDHGTEDYNLMVTGNKKLASEHDKLKQRCEGLEVELSKARSDTQKRIDVLEARVRSATAHSFNVATNGEKRLRDFKDGLAQKLEELCGLYAGNVQTISGVCSPVLTEEPSVGDYLRWLLEEISGLPDMFSGVNEYFTTAVIEGALTMASDLVDLDIVRSTAVECGANVLPTGPDVRRAVRAILKKWWHSFGYNYVLSVIRAKQREVLAYFQLLLFIL